MYQRYQSSIEPRTMMMTREDYYAQIADMQMYESKDKEIEAEDRRFREYLMRSNDRRFREYLMLRNEEIEAEDRRFREYLMLRNDDDDETWTETDSWYRSEKENPEDKALNDEELVETEVASELIGIKDGTVETAKNSDSFIESLEHELVSQVVGSVSDVLLVHIVDSHVMEVEELSQKPTSGNGEKVAHQLFDQMPLRIASKEKRRKSLKAWKFKFKPTSKRSKLRDDVFSFVEETAWFKKDPKETLWDCVKKEFKATMAGCGKTRVDRFKLVHATPRPGVYDKPLQSSVWDRGRSLLECVGEKSFGNDRFREVIAIVKLTHKPWDNQVWEPGGVLIEHDKWTWLETCYNHGRLMRFRHWMSSMCWKGTQDWIVSIWSKTQVFSDFDIASFIGLEICGFETKKHVLLLTKLANRVWECGELLATSQKMQKMDLFSFGTHTEMEENVELKQLLVAMERFSQEVIEQKIEGGLSCGDVKFHLKHKWRFRLLESFSVVKFGKYKACDALLLLLPSDERIWEKETHDVDITDAYYVLQEEFEQVENHTTCSVVKLERPQDHDALLLPSPGDERFQIKHKWRFKLLLSILELELYLDSLVLITSYAHQFDIISLIILMRVELSVFFSTKQDGFFFSTNLEVKVSLKGEDVIQVKRRKKNGTCGT